MPVNIHGKSYRTVAERVEEFRGNHPLWSLVTEVVSAGDPVIVRAEVRDEEGRVISSGLAEELRNSTTINKTSAMENAETSAVGRALAFFGYAGTEIASADEVGQAIASQAKGVTWGPPTDAASSDDIPGFQPNPEAEGRF